MRMRRSPSTRRLRMMKTSRRNAVNTRTDPSKSPSFTCSATKSSNASTPRSPGSHKDSPSTARLPRSNPDSLIASSTRRSSTCSRPQRRRSRPPTARKLASSRRATTPSPRASPASRRRIAHGATSNWER